MAVCSVQLYYGYLGWLGPVQSSSIFSRAPSWLSTGLLLTKHPWRFMKKNLIVYTQYPSLGPMPFALQVKRFNQSAWCWRTGFASRITQSHSTTGRLNTWLMNMRKSARVAVTSQRHQHCAQTVQMQCSNLYLYIYFILSFVTMCIG